MDYNHSTLDKGLSDLYEELETVNAQIGRELNDVNRIRLQRQARKIEQEIIILEEDHFAYRWAASRCLKLIHPGSQLEYIVVERPEADAQRPANEYVINITEYSNSDRNSVTRIAYFQLKHATANENQPLTLTDLRNTLQGFAARYSDHFCGAKPPHNPPIVTFTLITNRPISETLKHNLAIIGSSERIINQDPENDRIRKAIEETLQLKDEHLRLFCASLEFADGEGDYNVRRQDLRTELSSVLARTVDDPGIANIVQLVMTKAMSDSDGQICREDVLQRLGIVAVRELFPASPEFEKLNNVIRRDQHQSLIEGIFSASTPVIIHAGGGVGKSVVARQLADSLPIGSLGIIYDCFGGGKYRNRSQLRHRHRDALVQIANELASYSLCAPLIAGSALEDQIMQQFLTRIHTAAVTLRHINPNAILTIFVDAADNAEMAAKEFSQSCFAHELLRESIPEGCKVVMLCRTERIPLLNPPHSVILLALEPFTKNETTAHLRQHIPDASEDDALEFHRLTSGNPRVQANALKDGVEDIVHVLTSLGPLGTTVEDQIAAQLNTAVATVKDQFSVDYQNHIVAVCVGLAILPPFVPLAVLAAAADVNENAVKSFVSDLGHPLWLSDASVQFRDEPTETWFQETFSATVEQIASFITRIKPLAQTFTYVAEALPYLLLQAEKYEDLVNLALSDELLPDNPIDERNVRVYRLQFAFKAALKLGRHNDAIKLAIRAGEEVAGEKRQLGIIAKNVDLIAPLQSKQRVQELAFRQMLRSEWDGSGNVFSAALLSSVDDFMGEARGYLRAANNWLRLYFEERDQLKDKHQHEKLQDTDLVELTFAHYNLFGVEGAVDSLLRGHPPQVVYRLACNFIGKLIDAGDFEKIDEFAKLGSRNQYLMIAIAYELLKVGRFPRADSLQYSLILLATKRSRMPKPEYSFYDTTPLAIVSFAEACAARKLPNKLILRVLRHYFPDRASRTVSSLYQENDRETYLRFIALKTVLLDSLQPNLDDILPKDWSENERGHNNEIQEFKQVVGALLPWYLIRAQLLVNQTLNLFEVAENAKNRSKSARVNRWRDSDTLPYEISRIHISILALLQTSGVDLADSYFKEFLHENRQIRIQDRLKLVRSAYRLDYLVRIRGILEQTAADEVFSASGESPEMRAEWFIELARAVLPVDRADSAAYFNYAIEAVSKFGDEIVERWEAVAAIARRTAEGENISPEMACRFIRCAELIGDNVAREKHFDRDGAIKILIRLSPSSAFAALSRWRDRDVGWFNRQLSALAFEAVNSGAISPTVGWSLSAFFDGSELSDFAELCISKEQSMTLKQSILDIAVRDLRLMEAGGSNWQKLQEAALQYSLHSDELDCIVDFYANSPGKENKEINMTSGYAGHYGESEHVNWADLLRGLVLTISSDLSEAIRRYDEAPFRYRDHKSFWQEVYKRINESNANSFLQALVQAEKADRFDIQNAISQMPDHWRKKASIARNWDSFIRAVFRRFATEFTNCYTLKYFLESIGLGNKITETVRLGIIEGLANYSELFDASTLFGFVGIGSELVTPQQARELLDYALSRFELHIEDEYADGSWADWLMPPDNLSIASAGLIWAALGSPRSEIRWQAAHCVRRLAKTSCVVEIDALIGWMQRDEVGAFGSHTFPFYNLHARLYLLIALARVSMEHPLLLKKHHHIFAHHALEKMDHVLIQKFAAEIVLNIEKAFPGICGLEVYERLQKVGVSQFPDKTTERAYESTFSSPWHEREEVNLDLGFLHSWDFDRYWFEPLGQVFGIPGKQVEELATQLIVNEWKINNDGGFHTDPREQLWQQREHELETTHDHGSYPRVDNLSFYLSYHSMCVVAARLLQHMPVIRSKDWCEDEWKEWLKGHTLTKTDGYWLSDRRDPVPLIRRRWFYQKNSKDWRWEIAPDDFMDGLLVKRSGNTWLNVYGWWDDGDGEHREGYRIASALVSTKASQSLLSALTTCPADDFKLPECEEEQREFDVHPFELKGWICREDTYLGLDEFDPYAGTMLYPPYRLGELVVNKLQLTARADLREWFLPDADQASIICELWGTNKARQNEDPLRQGRRFSASLSFLKNLCEAFECELVIEVQIERRFRESRHSSNRDGNEYALPYHKIYLLSAEGKLRDTQTHYQLRESLS